MLGTGPLLGQALQNSWDRPALGTGPSKFLGQARPWDRPFIVTSGCCVHVRPFLLGIMLLSHLLSLGVVAEPPYAIKSDRGDGVAPSPPNHQLLSDEIRYRIVIIKLWLRGSGRGRGGIGSGSGHGVQSFNLPNEAFNRVSLPW